MLFSYFRKKWREHQRAIDLRILWPANKAMCKDIEFARRAFYLHISEDSAWYMDYTNDELQEYVGALE